MSVIHLNNSNLSIETTRKKSLQLMQKGMISYKLACLGWDISDHYGDGYDLLCTKNAKKTHIIQLELKGIDITAYLDKASGFSQSISQNEISTASHLIVTLFDGIEPIGHYVMTLSQMFMKIKTKGTKKFSAYDNFEAFRKFVYQATKERVNTKKGQKKKTSRLSIDIGCTFNKFKNQQWELHEFINKWENLEIENS